MARNDRRKAPQAGRVKHAASVADIGRARRVRRALDELRELAQTNPRVLEYLTGELAGPEEVQVPRPKTLGKATVTTLRVSDALLTRIEALRRPLERDPEHAPRGRLSQSDLLRLCLLQGVAALERRVSRERNG